MLAGANYGSEGYLHTHKIIIIIFITNVQFAFSAYAFSALLC